MIEFFDFLQNKKKAKFVKIKNFMVLQQLLKTRRNQILINSEVTPSTSYADIEYLIKRIDRCKDSPKISSRTKVSHWYWHLYYYSVFPIRKFEGSGNKHDVCRRKEYMKIFCQFLLEVNDITNKRSVGIIGKGKHLPNISSTINALMVTVIVNLKTIFIIQIVNTELLKMAYVT